MLVFYIYYKIIKIKEMEDERNMQDIPNTPPTPPDFSNVIANINYNLPDNNTQAITAAKMRTTLTYLLSNTSDAIYTKDNDRIIDSLSSSDTNRALSANQGKVLNTSIGTIQTTLSGLVIDNLTSTYTDKALSANQGRILNNSITTLNDSYNTLNGTVGGIQTTLNGLVIDNLTSTATNKALSANQGRILNNKINEIPTDIYSMNFAKGDLGFGDEEGNVLVEFKDGHIKTKYFDSSNIDIEVIDNVTSNYHDKALSAYQGTFLNNKIDAIKISSYTDNFSYGDFGFGDEDGNILVEFKNGHIKTKNFDSSYITPETDTYVENFSYGDFGFGDEEGNILVEFKNGHIRTKNFNSATDADAVGSEDFTRADFGFVDDSGNILVEFKNGHIKTKNFDSAEDQPSGYDILEKFKNKKMSVIGDSISTFSTWLPSALPGYSGATYATYYPIGEVNNVEYCWWKILAGKLGINDADLANVAWSGSTVTGDSTSTTSAFAGCSTKRITDCSFKFGGTAPDIILVYIGCNDWGNNKALGNWTTNDPIPAEGTINEFRKAYVLMLNKLHVSYPNARVFCLTNLDDTGRDQSAGWPSNNAGGISTHEWNNNIREIATAFGCDVIDLSNCGINYATIGGLSIDGLHPNKNGMKLVANKVFAELIAKY